MRGGPRRLRGAKTPGPGRDGGAAPAGPAGRRHPARTRRRWPRTRSIATPPGYRRRARAGRPRCGWCHARTSAPAETRRQAARPVPPATCLWPCAGYECFGRPAGRWRLVTWATSVLKRMMILSLLIVCRNGCYFKYSFAPCRRSFREQIDNGDIQGAREGFQGAERHVPLTALHRANVSAVQASLAAEFFLRPAALAAQACNIGGQDAQQSLRRLEITRRHPASRPTRSLNGFSMMPLNLQT